MSVLVSVIVPLFNGAATIVQTLQSALAQQPPVHEILVVDDGSSDAGPQLVAALPGVKLLRNEGKGPAAARQTGLRAATGERIAFLDHDDLWAPWHVAQLNRALDLHPGVALSAAQSMGFSLQPPTFSAAVDRDVFKQIDPWAWLPSCPIATPSCVLIRRAALEQIGGWSTVAATGDLYTYLVLGLDRPLLLCGPPSVAYRCASGSNSHQLRRSPQALWAAQLRSAELAYATRPGALSAERAMGLELLRQLPALGGNDPDALADVADLICALPDPPQALSHALSHARWLYWAIDPEQRESGLRQLGNLWPRAHSTWLAAQSWIARQLPWRSVCVQALQRPFARIELTRLVSGGWQRLRGR